MSERRGEAEPRVGDLLTAYGLGLLDADQRRRVETALAADPDLLDELYDDAPFAIALREQADRLAAAGRDGLRAGARAGVGRWWAALRNPRAAAVAAVLACTAVLLLLPRTDHRGRRLADLSPLDYARVEVRAAGSDADSLFTVAMDDYLARRWADAAGGLADAVAAAGSGNWAKRDQAELYRGSALLLAGHAAAALAPLGDAAGSPLQPVSERARWERAQARLWLGDLAGARSDLETLLASPVYGRPAERQLAGIAAASR